MKIQKSEIQNLYQHHLTSGLDDWDARSAVINSMINVWHPEEDSYTELHSPEYYFIIQTIWNLCDS